MKYLFWSLDRLDYCVVDVKYSAVKLTQGFENELILLQQTCPVPIKRCFLINLNTDPCTLSGVYRLTTKKQFIKRNFGMLS